MAAIDRERAEQKTAIEMAESLPEGFRYPIGEDVFDKEALVGMVKQGNASAISAMNSFEIPKSNQLGKRQECALCGTKTLCTKAGGGQAYCCDQVMVIKKQRPVPESD